MFNIIKLWNLSHLKLLLTKISSHETIINLKVLEGKSNVNIATFYCYN